MLLLERGQLLESGTRATSSCVLVRVDTTLSAAKLSTLTHPGGRMGDQRCAAQHDGSSSRGRVVGRASQEMR